MKYYGTLGPACDSRETLGEMVEAGMTGIRYNSAHGSPEEVRGALMRLKEYAVFPKGFDILVDLRGAKLRIGDFPGKLTLREGQEIELFSEKHAEEGKVSLPRLLFDALEVGDIVEMDDRRIAVKVLELEDRFAIARVVRGGDLYPRKAVVVEDKDIRLPVLSAEDERVLGILGECGVTELMVPFCERRADLLELRARLHAMGLQKIRIHAKVETQEGVRNAASFVDACDVLVIARGDLGNSFPMTSVPGIQKRLARLARERQKPFLVVTQLLDSMTQRRIPTRAEVSDIYNAVMDGASLLMLTGETAVGQYPAEAMEWLVDTAEKALEDLTLFGAK